MSRRRYFEGVSLFTIFLAAGFVTDRAHANPEDGVVSAGSANIVSSGSKLDVHQASDKVVIDWRSFNIGAGEHTEFHQPNSGSIALNRISSGDASQIMGRLSANGNVIIVNPSGVLFGKDSVVDVNGLVVTTSNISNADFMAGKLDFTAPGRPDASVINHGTITAKDAGLVGLVAPNVSNSGVITAKLGSVQLASGDKFSVDFYGDGLVNVALSDDVTKQVVANTGKISADGGTVKMTAATGAHVVNSLINISGEVTAGSVSQKDGKIIISGEDAVVMHTGTLSATDVAVRGKNISQQGQIAAGNTASLSFKKGYTDNQASKTYGKTIKVTGDTGSNAFVSGTYDASSATGNGGKVEITAKDGDLKLFGARVKADGKTGGGEILIGGDYQGSGATAHSKTTGVNYATTLSANATETGKGGKVIVWSDDTTLMGGKAYARGGALTGDGGLIEISSKDTMKIAGNAVTDAGATNGAAGSLLLDPKNIIIATGGINGGISSFEFVDPDIDAGDFGAFTYVSPTSGNVLVFDSQDDTMGTDAGAMYLFDGATGALISSLYGGTAGDQIGYFVPWGSAYTNEIDHGNLMILSYSWHNGAVVDAGAMTFFDMTNGVSGIMGAANSLVGSTTDDFDNFDIERINVGPNYTSTGKYLIRTRNWDNGAAVDAGAVTWFDSAVGLAGGVISSSTSLVGSSTNDHVGGRWATVLTNGNFILGNNEWSNYTGSATWVDNSVGITGVVSASNSLVGSTPGDAVGYNVAVLTNGNYVVDSEFWDNGGLADVGASTWGNGLTGISGTINDTNSILGTQAGDRVGFNTSVALTNGNYFIMSNFWANGSAGYAGAVTWANGATGITGYVSTLNSVVGSHTLDNIGGYGSVVETSTGDVILSSDRWNGGGAWERGAVTWISGAGPSAFTVDDTNSIVGSSASDRIQLYGVLANGNYVVGSRSWDNIAAGATNAGAIRVGMSDGSTVGAIDDTNSLVGTHDFDDVGTNWVSILPNNMFFAASPHWNDDRGAFTLIDGSVGITGAVSSSNSLVGSTVGDLVASNVTYLDNGNLIVFSPDWDNGAHTDAGALTWVDVTLGKTGVISSVNSLVGSSANDRVGGNWGSEVGNGNYVFSTPDWDNGGIIDAGAVTWMDGSIGLTGVLSAGNSLVGGTAGDHVGTYILTGNTITGDYYVTSPQWDDGFNTDVGAITWGDGNSGITGLITSSNSILGSTSGDQIGDNWNWSLLDDDSYVFWMPNWDSPTVTDAGAAIWLSASGGTTGYVDATNSLIGTTSGDFYSTYAVATNSHVAIISGAYDDGANADVGAVTILPRGSLFGGSISSANSFIGTSVGGGINSYAMPDLINNRFVAVFMDDQRVFSISASGGALSAYDSYSDLAASTITLDPIFITNVLNTGTAVTLQASNDITVDDDIIANNGGGAGGDLTLQAGRSIFINANITTDDGDLNIYANERLATGVVNAQRDAGSAVITMASGTTLDAGAGAVDIRLDDGLGKTNLGAGDITLRDIIADTIRAVNRNSTGDVIVESGTLAASSTAADSILLSSLRNFINNSGAGAFSVDPGSNWLVYSTRDIFDTPNGLVADYTLEACLYQGACPALQGGNAFLYSYDPNAPVVTPTTPAQTAPVPDTVLYVSQTPLSPSASFGGIRSGGAASSYAELTQITLNDFLRADTNNLSSLFSNDWVYLDQEVKIIFDLEVDRI